MCPSSLSQRDLLFFDAYNLIAVTCYPTVLYKYYTTIRDDTLGREDNDHPLSPLLWYQDAALCPGKSSSGEDTVEFSTGYRQKI